MVTSVDRSITLQELPHARVGSAKELAGLFRPGARNCLRRFGGERVVLDAPFLPPLLFTGSVEDARALSTNEDFSFGQALRRMTAHDVMFGRDSFIFLEGSAHRAERKLVSPPFHGRALKSYEDAFVAAVRNNLTQWAVGSPISFLEIGYQLSLDAILAVVFGRTDPGVTAQLKRTMHGWFKALESRAFLGLTAMGLFTAGHALPYLPLRRHQNAVDAVIMKEIADRRAGHGDLDSGYMAHMMQTNVERERPKSDAELARELRGKVFAGYETTALTLSWIAELVSHSPQVLHELQRSVDASDDSYLDAVIYEVLRLRPAVPTTGRRVLRDTDLNGVQLPKGTIVVIPTLTVHERPDLYEDPEAFKPERFLESRPGTYTWLPFGVGAHRCLGANLAILEARVLFRTLLQHRSLTELPGPPAPPRQVSATLVPSNGATVILEHR